MSWLKQLFSRRRFYGELSLEIREHIDERIEELVAEGMPKKEAAEAARREFGNMTLIEEDSRAIWQWPTAESFLSDVRYGVRMLRASPGFTAVAVLTLALGIGANAAIFSVVNAILLRPLPYPEPERLVRVWESAPSKGYFRNVVNPLNFLDWRDNSHSFESMAAILDLMTNLSANGEPVAVQGLQVSPQFFSILRVPPLLGRTFTSEDGVAGHHQVVILGYELWQRQFGANPQIIGQKMDVDAV